MNATTPTAGTESTRDPRRWLALAVLLVAAGMNLVDVTIVSVGMPSIRADLRTSAGETEWVIAAYSLPFALGLITGGRLGDIYGRRRVFLIGVAGFTLASVVCGAASSAGALIGGRAAQGAFAALMVPQVLATMQVLFTGSERQKALGLWGSMLGLATVASPLLGALLLEGDIAGLHWRPIFLVNVPLGLLALAGAAAYVPESRSEHPLRLDLAGTGLVTIASLLLMYPLIQGRALGWPVWTFVAMAAAIPAFVLFAVHQRRVGDEGSPLVPPRLFRERGFTGGVLLGLVFFSGIVGFSLVLQLALQDGLRFSPLHGALTVLPFSVGIVIASPVAMQVVSRLGRLLPLAGALLMVLGTIAVIVAVQAAGPALDTLELLPGMLICGLAVGAVAPTLVGVALADIRQADAGAASGVISAANQIGAAIGVAAMGAIFFGLLPGAGAIAAPASRYTSALANAMWYDLGVFVLSAALVALLPRRRPASAPQPEEAAATAPRPMVPEEIRG